MSILHKVYERLAKNPNDRLAGIKLYRSDTYMVRNELQRIFDVELTLEEVDRWRKEELELEKAVHKIMQIIRDDGQNSTTTEKS